MSEKAFLEQIRINQGIIYKLVGLYADSEEEKKDLYQEILLQTWRGWHTFRGDAKFSSWLYRICLNTIFTQKRKHHPVDYRDSMETVSASVENNSLPEQETEGLKKAIRTLSESDRAIISMHLDGYDNREIGTILGITANLVSVKIHRIKKQLANLLKTFR